MNSKTWSETVHELDKYKKEAPIKVEITKETGWINRYYVTVTKAYYKKSQFTTTFWGAKRLAKKYGKELEEYVNPHNVVVFKGLMEELEEGIQ